MKSKTYKKTHTARIAADTHLAKIKKRGGKATMKEVGGKFYIEYSFPEKKKYDVISPDGFSIRIGVPLFKSKEERDAYFEKWKKRFEGQGYYSSNSGRIPLNQLAKHCKWVEE